MTINRDIEINIEAIIDELAKKPRRLNFFIDFYLSIAVKIHGFSKLLFYNTSLYKGNKKCIFNIKK